MAASSQGENGSRAGREPVLVPDLGPIETLLEHGTRMRPHSPELALVLGERAAALAEAAGSERHWVHAESLAVFARIQLGHRACVADRAVAALRAAEAGGYHELAAALRTDLALCARSVGIPLVGLAAIRPVLADRDVSAVQRAVALLQFVGCMATLGRRGVLDRALAEADELVSEDRTLTEDTRATLRAAVRTRAAAHLRRSGDLASAIAEARRGLELLDTPMDRAADTAWLRARLVLELAGALLDRGGIDEAAAMARPLIAAPARAASVAPVAWLRLAVATRILLPSGAAEAAGTLVRDALYYASRHGLQALSARLWLELAHIEELLGRPAETVKCLHAARVNEHLYSRVRRQANSLLISEFGRGEQSEVDPQRLLGDQAKAGRSRSVPSPRAAAPLEGVAAKITESGDTVRGAGVGSQHAVAEWQNTPVQSPAAHAGPLTSGAPLAPRVPSSGKQSGGHRKPEPAPEEAEPAYQQVAESPAPDLPGVAERSVAKHDVEAPSARSVLARFGVDVGSGGRRRAADHQRGEGQHAASGHIAGSAAGSADRPAAVREQVARHHEQNRAEPGAVAHREPERPAAAMAHHEPEWTAAPTVHREPERPALPPAHSAQAPTAAAVAHREPEHLALPKLKLPGPLAPPGALFLTGDELDRAEAAYKPNFVDRAPEQNTAATRRRRPEEPSVPPKATRDHDLNSVLAVFSNWNDDDEAAANGVAPKRVVNGDSSVTGRHRGPA